MSYHPDHDTAMEKTRFWAPLALTAEEKMSVHDPIEMQRLANELPIERAASRFIVSTDPDEHVERIAQYVDLGFRHLVFHDPARPGEFRFACTATRSSRACAKVRLRRWRWQGLHVFAAPRHPRTGIRMPGTQWSDEHS